MATSPSPVQPPNTGLGLSVAVLSVLRILCLGIGVVLIYIGITQVMDVFGQIKQLVTTGEGFEQTVGNMSEAIRGEQLAVNNVNGEGAIEIGRTVAMAFLFAWYFSR